MWFPCLLLSVAVLLVVLAKCIARTVRSAERASLTCAFATLRDVNAFSFLSLILTRSWYYCIFTVSRILSQAKRERAKPGVMRAAMLTFHL